MKKPDIDSPQTPAGNTGWLGRNFTWLLLLAGLAALGGAFLFHSAGLLEAGPATAIGLIAIVILMAGIGGLIAAMSARLAGQGKEPEPGNGNFPFHTLVTLMLVAGGIGFITASFWLHDWGLPIYAKATAFVIGVMLTFFGLQYPFQVAIESLAVSLWRHSWFQWLATAVLLAGLAYALWDAYRTLAS